MADACSGNKPCIPCGYMVVPTDSSGFKDEASVVSDCATSDETASDEGEVPHSYLGESVSVAMSELAMSLVDSAGRSDGCLLSVCSGSTAYAIVYCTDLGRLGRTASEPHNLGKSLSVSCLGTPTGVSSPELSLGLVV